MRAKSTLSALRRQRDRAETVELLRIYGDLLNSHQYQCVSGFVTGKTFSQMGRELGVSRQAVHEAVRAVQRQLRWYEEKLGLMKLEKDPAAAASAPARDTSTPPPAVNTAEVVQRLRMVAEFVGEQGIIYSPSWIAQELQEIINSLKNPTAEQTAGRAKRTRTAKRSS